MKILIIEDEKNVIDLLRDEISSKFLDEYPNLQIEESGFVGASTKIDSLEPDVVILDITVPGTPIGEQEPGVEIVDKIWKNRFCPLIIYTAVPHKIEDANELEQHPFVEIVTKGKDSENRVIDELSNFDLHVKALNEAEKRFRNTYHQSMRYLASYVFNVPDIDDQERVNILLRSGRRRFAALCDHNNNNELELESWEQYIFPPLTNDLSLGDIIQKTGAEFSDLESFRVILTPSCDLVTSQNRASKVNDVLVAKCCSIPDALQKVSLSRIKEGDIISKVLNSGYYGVMIPFPELANIIPSMAANLRDLELIQIDKIHKDGDGNLDPSKHKYNLIASLDSPFKELVSWAYQQVACRPGLPDRNVEAWAKEIKEQLNQNKEN